MVLKAYRRVGAYHEKMFYKGCILFRELVFLSTSTTKNMNPKVNHERRRPVWFLKISSFLERL